MYSIMRLNFSADAVKLLNDTASVRTSTPSCYLHAIAMPFPLYYYIQLPTLTFNWPLNWPLLTCTDLGSGREILEIQISQRIITLENGTISWSESPDREYKAGPNTEGVVRCLIIIGAHASGVSSYTPAYALPRCCSQSVLGSYSVRPL